MQAVIWWVFAAALVIAELLSGTFYLLMLALAAVAGGVAALAGAALTVQLFTATVCALAALAALRRARKRWHNRCAARAMYRGAQWNIEYAGTEQPGNRNWYEIREVRGNCLVVAPLEASTTSV